MRRRFNYTEMIKFAKIEYTNFKEHGNPLYIHDGMLDLASAYHYDLKYDSAIIVCRQLLDSALMRGDRELEEDARRNMALSYFGWGKYDSAAVIYKYICETDYTLPSDSAYLGLIYLRNNMVSKAKSIIPQSTCTNNVGTWMKYNILLSLGNRDSALTVLQDIMTEHEKRDRELIRYNLSGALMDYHAYKLALEHERSRFSKAMLWLAVFVTIMIIIVGAYFSYRHIRRQRLQIEKNIMLADNLREMLETKDENHNRMILDLLGDRFAMLDDFCRVMYEKGNSVQAKKMCRKLSRVSSDSFHRIRIRFLNLSLMSMRTMKI